MPERKPPQNFKDMIEALDLGVSEDIEAILSLSEPEVDELLAEKEIDPTHALNTVQQVIQSARQQSKRQSQMSPYSQKPFLRNPRKAFWTHPSVLALGEENPIQYICSRASDLVLEALERGWKGPPYDPAQLASYSGIRVVPNAEVADARAVPVENSKMEIQFNPSKARARVRFSIAHELAHTLFPDCHFSIRNRLSRHEQKADDWQLEMLCNIAAAEFLMPMGSFPELKRDANIRQLLDLRKEFEVSMEAILLRFARLTEVPCAVFAASRRDESRYTVEYSVSSRSWPISIRSGSMLPEDTRLRECTAVGYTAEGEEEWFSAVGRLHVQCVAISPFHGESLHRVVGVIRPPLGKPPNFGKLALLRGDATEPRGTGFKIIAQIVNDKTPNWGAGFALAVRRKWPHVQEAFRKWATTKPKALTLGNTFYSDAVEPDITIFHMICQHGYGPSTKPRIRYAVLKACLEQLANFAIEKKASIHMPMIGAGQAGGSWPLIKQLIDEIVCGRGLEVTVYELPTQLSMTPKLQPNLFG